MSNSVGKKRPKEEIVLRFRFLRSQLLVLASKEFKVPAITLSIVICERNSGECALCKGSPRISRLFYCRDFPAATCRLFLEPFTAVAVQIYSYFALVLNCCLQYKS